MFYMLKDEASQMFLAKRGEPEAAKNGGRLWTESIDEGLMFSSLEGAMQAIADEFDRLELTHRKIRAVPVARD